MKKTQITNDFLKMFKNEFLRKKILILLILVSTLFSCSKDNAGIITSDGEISNKLLSDPLFEKMDKAYYDVGVNLLTYRNLKVDKNLVASISTDVKNKKIKSYEEYYNRMEQAGEKDFKKRLLANLYLNKCKAALFKKYPELTREENKGRFMDFFLKNRKHKDSPEDTYLKYLKKDNPSEIK